ncbi:protein CYSTEINE-RICH TRANSMEMBRANE MODULE 11-like [Gossypium arboreum]|uniref:protein CYSTEINE-RICH TRANSMEMBRANE MODULE 11-like n=1 Tax=Gossypium arboreum TaxID=29729 RepID=UPI0022F168E5|nr:protein CYSTEINE-RICH TRANSMEMBRANE MODULE 11-like [Gossypium arboreum]
MSDPKYAFSYAAQGYYQGPPVAYPYPAQFYYHQGPPVMAPPPQYAAPPPRPGFLEGCLTALRCCCLIGECCSDSSIFPVS